MRILIFNLVLFATVCGAQIAAANDAAKVRTDFQRAYAEIEAPTATDSEALRTYILYPYLQAARLKVALNQQTKTGIDSAVGADIEIEAFLKSRDNEPVTRDLRRVWYASLANRKQWERLQSNYRDMNDASLRCHALAAGIALQKPDAQAALELWSKANNSLPACESVFSWLKAERLLTPTHIERRARLSLSAGNSKFARQLLVDLPPEVAAPLTVWANFIEQPARFISAASKTSTGKRIIEPAALLDGWTRLARADQNQAIQLYKPLVRSQQLPKEAASRFALELALALSWSRNIEALRYFSLVDARDFDERAIEWHARAAIWANDWARVNRIVADMPENLRKQTRWRYWSARSTEQLGDRNTAKARYLQLQGDDNYYAALAAARLGQPYSPRLESLNVDAQQVSALEQQSTFQRARELLAVGLTSQAHEEWREGYAKLGLDSRSQAIALAARWGWHEQAIVTAAQLSVFNDYVLLYPRPFDNEINAAAQLTQIPPTLIYATLRQESLYRSDALSSAGAQGLMQLLPTTAKRTARRWQFDSPEDLFAPATNISLGAALLSDLQKNFRHPAAALAAYNAGPGAAQRWITEQSKASDVWIENIPYNETRTYVQRVLWHSVIFGWIATGSAQDTSFWLNDIRKPT
jgi:soluble lytic murein transglycosylase